MWQNLQSEVDDRLLQVEVFLNSTCRPGYSKHAAMAKGISFVTLYACFEYCVTNLFEEAVREVESSGFGFKDLHFELLSLLLESRISGYRDAGKKKSWQRRIDLFKMFESSMQPSRNETAFPSDGSHFRKEQIQTLWTIFGINQPIGPNPRAGILIGEIVGHRNDIAHGKERAEVIGGRYSKSEVLSKISSLKSLCTYLIQTCESHCINHQNFLR